MSVQGIFPYVDNPRPSYEEAIDYVVNAVVEMRSRPQAAVLADAVNEHTYIVGLISLYFNGTEPQVTRAQAASPNPMTLSVMTQTILQRSYMQGAAESATRARQQAKNAKGRNPR